MSIKFKVGDRIRRINCDWDGYIVGWVYTVSSYNERNGGVKTEESLSKFSADDRNFELVRRGDVTKTVSTLEEKDMSKSNSEWKFSVSSDKLIDLHEISESLTRETPCAIVHRGDGYSTVVLHDNLYTKHTFMKREIREAFEDAVTELHSNVWQLTASGYLTPLMAAIKAVHTQPVRKIFRNKCDVTVQQVSL